MHTIDVGVTVTVESKSRIVTVTGPRGSLTKNFAHSKLAITKLGKRRLRMDMWFGNRKQLACIRSICSSIENMITGVTKGFSYKMRFAYAHFPINVTITGDKNIVEIRNFLGERRVRKIKAMPGVTVSETKNKDEIEIVGNDNEAVGRTCALIHQSVLVRNKDIRKFLDGIYVSEKGPIGASKPI